MSKPFRFGVQSFNAASGADWAAKVRQAESLGYSAFHLADHLLGPGPALEATNHPVQNLAAIPAMAYAAAVTESIHIGCRVFCIDYHNPVVLAKSAMTIDHLSGRPAVNISCHSHISETTWGIFPILHTQHP